MTSRGDFKAPLTDAKEAKKEVLQRERNKRWFCPSEQEQTTIDREFEHFAVSRLLDISRGAADSAWTDLIRRGLDISKDNLEQTQQVQAIVAKQTAQWAAKPTFGFRGHSIPQKYVDEAAKDANAAVAEAKTRMLKYAARFADEKNLIAEFVDSWYRPDRIQRLNAQERWTIENEARWVLQHFNGAPMTPDLQARLGGIVLARFKELHSKGKTQ